MRLIREFVINGESPFVWTENINKIKSNKRKQNTKSSMRWRTHSIRPNETLILQLKRKGEEKKKEQICFQTCSLFAFFVVKYLRHEYRILRNQNLTRVLNNWAKKHKNNNEIFIVIFILIQGNRIPTDNDRLIIRIGSINNCDTNENGATQNSTTSSSLTTATKQRRNRTLKTKNDKTKKSIANNRIKTTNCTSLSHFKPLNEYECLNEAHLSLSNVRLFFFLRPVCFL